MAARGVTAAYNGRPVLAGVDVEVAAGEWVALIGPNGAGKTTLLRALAGTLPAGGQVSLGGSEMSSLSRREIAQRVAVVPQDPVIPEGVRVLDYVLLGRTPYVSAWGAESDADVAAAHGVLTRLGLDALAGRAVTALSGGERQRVVLARALAQDATILLLDEPTASLDIGHQQEVMELVDGLRRERGLAVLSALHDLTLAGHYGDRLILLDSGRVVAAGPAAAVLTPELLRRHYGVSVRILADDGGLVVVPGRTGTAGKAPASR